MLKSIHKNTLVFFITALIPGHFFSWGVEWGFSTATTILGIFYFRHFSRLYPQSSRLGLIALYALTFISLIGYICTIVLSNFPTGSRDLVELLKPAMVFFSCAFALVSCSTSLENIRKACFLVLTFAVFCGFILMFQVPILSPLVDFVYADTKTGFSEFRIRLSIPFENPNFFGLFSALSLVISLFFSLRLDLKLMLVSLCAVALSGSRTAWLTSAFVLIVFSIAALVSSLKNPKNISISKIFVAILLPIGAAYYLPLLGESLSRVSDFFDLVTNLDFSSDASYAERQSLRNEAMNLLLQRPIFGWGAVKYSNLDIVDNQYYSLFLRFGVLGSAIAVLSGLVIFFAHILPLFNTKQFKNGLLIWLVLLAWLWTGTFLENIRLVIIITLIFAAVSKCHGKSIH